MQQGQKYLDVDIFEYSTKQMRRSPRTTRKKQTTPKQFAANDKNAIQKFVQLVNTNFGEGDYLIDPTYKQEPKTPEEAEKHLKKYIRDLRELYKKHGTVFKYVYVTEGGREKPEGGYTRIHHHLIVSGGVPPEEVKALWVHGRTKLDLASPYDDEHGLEPRAKYMLKKQRRPEDKNKRRWGGSLNLKKPVVTRNDNKYTPGKIRKLIEADNNGTAKQLIEKWYKGWICTKCKVDWNPTTWWLEIRVKLCRDKNTS